MIAVSLSRARAFSLIAAGAALAACESRSKDGATGAVAALAAPTATSSAERKRAFAEQAETVTLAGKAFDAPPSALEASFALSRLRWSDGPPSLRPKLSDLDGEWGGRRGLLTIAAGRWRQRGWRATCESRGRLALRGARLTLILEATDCPRSTKGEDSVRVGLGDDRLVFDRGSGARGLMVMGRGPIRTQSLRLVDDRGRVLAMKLFVDGRGRPLGGGYHGEPGCELLSCGGEVVAVEASKTDLRLWTVCTSDCPCSGRITLERGGDGKLDGRYVASNCKRMQSAALTATLGPLVAP